jgi:hypothetical protein
MCSTTSTLEHTSSGDAELGSLLERASAENWRGAASEALGAAIERRVVDPLSSRLRAGLGSGEAESVARFVAWQRSRVLANSMPTRLTWGYLANHVRWRVTDRLDAELLRACRHPLTDRLPEVAAPNPAVREELGPAVELLVDKLESYGCAPARTWVAAALDGDRLGRQSIIDRLIEAHVPRDQANALATLLRGDHGFVSVVARFARGECPDAVFTEPAVRQRLARLACPRAPLKATARSAQIRSASPVERA